jgi:hypothetical protein
VLSKSHNISTVLCYYIVLFSIGFRLRLGLGFQKLRKLRETERYILRGGWKTKGKRVNILVCIVADAIMIRSRKLLRI